MTNIQTIIMNTISYMSFISINFYLKSSLFCIMFYIHITKV